MSPPGTFGRFTKRREFQLRQMSTTSLTKVEKQIKKITTAQLLKALGKNPYFSGQNLANKPLRKRWGGSGWVDMNDSEFKVTQVDGEQTTKPEAKI